MVIVLIFLLKLLVVVFMPELPMRDSRDSTYSGGFLSGAPSCQWSLGCKMFTEPLSLLILLCRFLLEQTKRVEEFEQEDPMVNNF